MKKLNDAINRLQNRRAKGADEGGFSFIELVIVVAVIGILTAIAIPAYGAIQNTARVNSVASTAQQAYSAAVAAEAQSRTDAEIASAATSMSTDQITVTFKETATGDPAVKAVWTAKSSDEGHQDARGVAGNDKAAKVAAFDALPGE